MVEKIEWSLRFAEQIKEIILHLREKNNESTVEKFKITLEKKILRIAQYPTAHRKVMNRKSIRFTNFMKTIKYFTEYKVKPYIFPQYLMLDKIQIKDHFKMTLFIAD